MNKRKKGLPIALLIVIFIILFLGFFSVFNILNTKKHNLTGYAIGIQEKESNTKILISDEVIRENAPRLGANIGGDSYWDSYWRGKYTNNNMILGAESKNPGFENGCQRHLISPGQINLSTSNFTRLCSKSYEIDAYGGGGYIFRKHDFWKGARAYIMNNSNNAWIVGTEVIIKGSTPYNGTLESNWKDAIPGSNCIYIDKPVINLNNTYVILEKCDYLSVLGIGLTSWDGYIKNKNYNVSFMQDKSTYVTGNASAKVVIIRANNSVRTFSVGVGTSMTTMLVGPKKGVNYTLSFWMKGTNFEKPDVMVYFNNNLPKFYFNVTEQWKKYDFTFEGNNTPYFGFGLYPYGNLTMWIDNMELKETNSGEFMDYQLDLLNEFKPGVLRFINGAWGGIDFDEFMKNSPYERGAMVSRGFISHSLPEELRLSKLVNARPYLNIPASTTPDEMKFLIEYLNGPTTSKGGTLRAQHGHSAPWTNDFDVIYLELGNEMWNWGFLPFAFDDANQARWFNSRYDAAVSSPYYSNKIKLIEGGQHVNTWKTSVFAQVSRNFTHLATAAYWSPNDAYLMKDPAIEYKSMFAGIAFTDLYNIPMHKKFLRDANKSSDMVIYELGLDIHCYDVNSAVFRTNKTAYPKKYRGIEITEGLLGNLAIFDSALMYLRHNFSDVNLFFWDSDGVCAWAMMRGYMVQYRKPVFYAAELYNNYIADKDMINFSILYDPADKNKLYYDYLLNDSIYGVPGNRITTTASLPYLKIYPFKKGTNYGVVVINTHLTQTIPVTISLPLNGTRKAEIRYLTADNYETNNTDRENIVPQYAQTSFDQNLTISLAPYSGYIISTSLNNTADEECEFCKVIEPVCTDCNEGPGDSGPRVGPSGGDVHITNNQQNNQEQKPIQNESLVIDKEEEKNDTSNLTDENGNSINKTRNSVLIIGTMIGVLVVILTTVIVLIIKAIKSNRNEF